MSPFAPGRGGGGCIETPHQRSEPPVVREDDTGCAENADLDFVLGAQAVAQCRDDGQADTVLVDRPSVLRFPLVSIEDAPAELEVERRMAEQAIPSMAVVGIEAQL